MGDSIDPLNQRRSTEKNLETVVIHLKIRCVLSTLSLRVEVDSVGEFMVLFSFKPCSKERLVGGLEILVFLALTIYMLLG